MAHKSELKKKYHEPNFFMYVNVDIQWENGPFCKLGVLFIKRAVYIQYMCKIWKVFFLFLYFCMYIGIQEKLFLLRVRKLTEVWRNLWFYYNQMGGGVSYCECKYANFKLFNGNKSIQKNACVLSYLRFFLMPIKINLKSKLPRFFFTDIKFFFFYSTTV